MHFEIITPGRSKQPFLVEGEREYLKRIRQFARIELIELEHKLSKRPIPEIIEREGQLILKKASNTACLIALDEKGESYSSSAFAELMALEFNQGTSSICFAIGGAHGLSKEVTDSAKYILSLSTLTFTSGFARFILAEQIYRAISILKGLPYHKQ